MLQHSQFYLILDKSYIFIWTCRPPIQSVDLPVQEPPRVGLVPVKRKPPGPPPSDPPPLSDSEDEEGDASQTAAEKLTAEAELSEINLPAAPTSGEPLGMYIRLVFYTTRLYKIS